MVAENLLHLTLRLWSPGSQTLSLREYMFLTGLLSMSQFVFKVFFYGNVVTKYSRKRVVQVGMPTQRIKQVVSIMSPVFSFSLRYELTNV